MTTSLNLYEKPFKGWQVTFLVAISTATLLLIALWDLGFDSLTVDAMLMIIRFTGRISLPLFWAVALADPLFKLYPCYATQWLVANRKYTGLSFGVVHFYHFLGVLGIIYYTGGPVISGIELGLSIVGYGFLAAMIVTTFNTVRTRMSPWLWSSIHGTGMLIFWYFFVAEYSHLAEEVHGFFFGLLAFITAMILPLKVIAAAKPIETHLSKKSTLGSA